MANLDKTVNIIFAGKDELSVTTRKLYKELGDFGGGVTALSGSLSSLADKILMADAALLALVAGGLTYAVKKSSEFNQGFALISTSVDATGDKLAKYRQDVIDYGTTSVKSYQEVNAALYTAAQAGIKYTDSIDFMRKSEELAVANNANLNTTVDLLTGTMNAYGYKLQDVGHLNDVFFQSTLIGKQTIDDLGQSMGQVVGIAAASGVSFEELSAAIATLTAKGMNTAEAITAVRGVITTIISPSKEASNAATELGMTFSASSLKAKGFTQMLIDIMEKTGGSTDKLALLFNEMRAMNGIMQLTGDKMVFFNDAMKQIANSAGVSTDAYNKMVVTFKNQSQQVMNIVEAMLFSIGTKIEPMLAEFAKGLGSVFAGIKIGIDKGYFDELFVYLETQGKSLVLMLQKIAKNIPAVMEQINWDGVLKSFDNLGSSIKQAFQAVFGNIDLSTLDGLRIFVQKLVDGFAALNNVTAGIIDGMKPLFMMIGAGADQFSKMSEGTAELAGNVLGMAKSFYITTTYLEPLKDVFQILASAGFLVVNIGNLTTAINTMTASVGFMNAAVAMSPLGLAAVVASAGLATGAALNYAGFMEEEGKQLGEDIYDFFHGPSGAEQIGKQLTKMAEEANEFAKALDKFPTQKNVKIDLGIVDVINQVKEITVDIDKIPRAKRIDVTAELDKKSLDVLNSKISDTSQNKTIEIEVHGSDEEIYKIKSKLEKEFKDMKKDAVIDVTPIANNESIIKVRSSLSGTTEDMYKMKEAIGSVSGKEVTVKAIGDTRSMLVVSNAINKAIPDKKDIKVDMDITKGITGLHNLENLTKEKSEVIKTALEWKAKVNIAQVEAATKQIEAAFKSVDNTISETGKTISSLGGDYSKVLLGGQDSLTLSSAIYDQTVMQQDATKNQGKLIDAQVALLKAKTSKLEKGENLITIQADGMEPQIEAFMWKILNKIQIRANEEAAEFLLGLPAGA